MNEVLAFLLSPWGVAAYAGFWALKIVFGAWLLGRLLPLLPAGLRRRIEALAAQPRLAVARVRRAK
ncbi:hypothetical protein [Actibacterium ureilyticum]|uniref:hypothetical protein n=1 Tax=Actibacterium ureilyticum TaxID=1590614 RepID=UPI000BAAEE29|nr:hypothetical protein [Actibacterium ureilyticum]